MATIQEIASGKLVDDQSWEHQGSNRFLDSNLVIANATDSTKTLIFDCSNLTPGVPETFDPAAGGGTVTLDGEQTLSNKTLASPIVTGTTTGTDLAITSTGDLDLTASGAAADMTCTAGRNIDFASSGGYINLETQDGDVSLITDGAGDDIILGAASNGGTVYINSSLRLDRQAQAGTGDATWRSILGVTSTANDVAISIPTALNIAGAILIVKDESGGAATHNITVTPVSGTIDGAANKVINSNYGVLRLYGDGTNFFTW